MKSVKPFAFRWLAPAIAAACTFSAHAENVDWKTELKKADGKTLRIIMIQDPWVDAFDKIDQDFQDITGAKVVVDSYSYDDVHQKEVLMGNSKSDSYDVIVLDSPWVGEFQQGGYVENLKPYIDKDAKIVQWEDFVPSFIDVANWKGSIVGIPFGAYFVMFNYRTDLFQQAGLQPPKTVEDFQNDAKIFTNNPKFPGLVGTALNNQRGAAVGQAFFEYIFNFGGKPFESTYPGSPNQYGDMTPLFDSPQGIAVVKFFKDMMQYEPPGALNIAWDERANAFAASRIAMVAEWSVREPIYADPNRSRVVGKFATEIFPHKEGTYI